MDVGTRGDHRLDQSVQRCAVRLDRGAELESLPATHDRHPVHPDFAADQHDITGTGSPRANVDTVVDHPDARGVDEYAVAVAAVHYFGITGDQPHSSGSGGMPDS